MPIRKDVTQKTIAKELGLTVQTVSKALKGKPGMSETTRQLILETMEQRGYFTKDQIRSLRAEHISPYPVEKMRFLLAQTEASLNYHARLIGGLQDRFASFGHHIEVCMLPTSIRSSEMSGWLEERGIAYTDGIFIAPSLTPKSWEDELLKLPIPKILLSYPPLGTKVDSVIWDIYEATFQAVAYLRSIGHVHIMYVGDTHQQRGFILRWQAFQHAMNEFEAAIDPRLHSIDARNTNPHWLEDLRAKLLRHAPTALICGVDGEVPAVYQLCTELGLRIPEDISLIGMLNEQPASLPEFTRPLLSVRETGYRAADRMLWRIANPTLPCEHIRIQGELWIGGTTAENLKPSNAQLPQ
ncbi:LacI family DNA-binding transcriptional regulator [Paenibacillus silvestris]|uniref:LacI family DNA-binding transcriptional regulator n=1 Tax=Paenibacillus silvestris TaxID=2606219 RepID=UPI0013726AB6|nr:LacI family DNA-binding transcriptional regulator [Paenibacillus silvestris]